MNYELKNIVIFGNATTELQALYSQGWRLVTTTTPYALSLPEKKLILYAVEYFLERKS